MDRKTFDDQIKQKIVECMIYQEEADLVSRKEWVNIDFKNAERDLERIFDLLESIPIAHLVNGVKHQLDDYLDSLLDLFRRWDKFDLQQENPAKARDDIISECHSIANRLYATPTLEAASMLEDMRKKRESSAEMQKELRDMLSRSRRDLRASGSDEFEHEFEKEENDNRKLAKQWLWATGGFTLAVGCAIAFIWFQVFCPQLFEAHELRIRNLPPETAGTILRNAAILRIGGNLVAVAFLLTAAVWCGRMYKTYKHLAAAYRHRSLGVRTFWKFYGAADDETVQEALLLEMVRSLFGPLPTGFLDMKEPGAVASGIVNVPGMVKPARER